MITQEEKQQAIYQAMAQFSSDYMNERGDEHSIYEMMRDMKAIPSKYQYGVTRLYKFFSTLRGYLLSRNFERKDEDAYLFNELKQACGEPRVWRVFLEEKSRPFPHMRAHAIPFGTKIDTFFAEEEKKVKDVRGYTPPLWIYCLPGEKKKAKLVKDRWIQHYTYGYVRELIYQEEM